MIQRTADGLGDVLTVPEVAAKLRMHSTTINKMCRDGAFDGAFRAGNGRGRWRIPAAGFRAYLGRQGAALECEATSATPQPAAA